MDAERESERQQLETLKRGLERQLRETEAEMDIQRKDLNAGLIHTSFVNFYVVAICSDK